MKELSVEEKARRYDEALGRAKEIHAEERAQPFDVMLKVFPELKEGEGEKWIPKEIAKYLKEKGGFRSCWLAWLEKQCEQPKKHDVCDNCDQQGCYVSPCSMKLVEKQGEQKPANNVEPEFKIGDWVVVDGVTQQVTQIRPEGFETDKAWNGKLTFKDVHLWTIQDAKNGDVLATPDYILIFKEFFKNDGGISYCLYDFGARNPQFIWSEDRNWYFGKEAIVHPATNEQRDTLMKAMADAGYTFDFEKRELKKIEQKPAWSEEDEKMIEHICYALPRMANGNIKILPSVAEEYVERLKSLRPQSQWKPSERQKEALLWCVVHLGGADKQALGELLEELNKL